MPSWSSMPWYGQIILFIVVAIIAVFLFREIILPLIGSIT